MKFLVSSIFLLALAGAACAFNVKWGERNGVDELLSSQVIFRAPNRNKSWILTVEYPRAKLITAVNVFDNFRNTSGALATLSKGGPSWTYATVSLNSLVNYGINSTVEFWGRR